jgi:cholest-4-en-3-one 26-monooxygenase
VTEIATDIGAEIDFVSGAFWGRNPHEELAWLRANDPVHWDGRVWGITRHADIRAASRNAELFSSAKGIRPEMDAVPHMIDMDAPAHSQRRRLVSAGFTPRRVADLEQRVREMADDILDRVCERGECDLVRDVAAWLPIELIGAALGFDSKDYGSLLEWSDAMMSGLVGSTDEATMTRVTEAFGGYVGYIMGVIAERRDAPLDDLISILVHAEVDGERLDESALIHESLLILVGGDETSRHVISGGVYQLLRNETAWHDLRRDPDLLGSATEEMLRWVSPIKNMARALTRDAEFGGKKLLAGQKVLLLYPSANRDETVFDDPFRFDIRRTPNDHLAFGIGHHFCLGNQLARLEVRIMVERLLARMPDLTLVEDTEPTYRPANFVSGYESMPVRFTPSKPVRRT